MNNNFNNSVAYNQLKSFLLESFEVNLDFRQDIQKDIVQKYVVDINKNAKMAEKNLQKRVDFYFKADDIDKKIIQRKLDRMINELK